MKFTSVRFRLTAWTIGMLALVLFGFLLVAHFSIRGYLLTTMDQRLQEMSDRQMRMFERFDSTRRPPAPRREEGSDTGDRRRRNSRFQRFARLFDLHGKAILPDGTPATGTDTEPPWDRPAFAQAAGGTAVFSTIQQEDAQMRVLTRPLVRHGKQIGVMEVAVSFTEMQTLLESLTTMLLLLIPCALVLAGAGGLFITHSAMRPVRAIAGAAEQLSHEDLSQRLPVDGADEFAHLATTMNGMLGRLEHAFSRLTESVARERRFTADASHELRTPLTAIKANASLALRGERTPEQYREALQAIDQAAESMHRLVQDMLLLARSDNNQLMLQFEPVDPRALLEEAAALVPHHGGQAPVRVQVDPETRPIQGDQHHLQRLVVNLLENALRHTPPEGDILLEARNQGDRVALTVADTGEGIAPEHLPHLGERFFRVDAARARQHGGAGLGLAICRHIVEAHGGTMEIESTLGEGTRVTVVVPGVEAGNGG